MNINPNVEKAINKQIKAELDSAYMYLAMSAYLESENFPGMAKWMRMQHDEEVEHAMKFFDYVNERGGRVVLESLDRPQTNWKSALDVFEQGYNHEMKVTQLIHDIFALAQKEKDFATLTFLKWFIDEQVEEEANASAIVEKLKMAGPSKGTLLMIDKHLGKRE